MTKKAFPKDLKFAGEQILSAFCHWHETGMVSTLGDLLRTLREVEDEMLCYDGDALIADHCDDLGITTDYVRLFDDPSEQDHDLPLTFEYRLANVEEDIMHVEELIEGLGESFKFGDLQCMTKKPTAA